MILVDSSWLIAELRQKSDFVRKLSPWIQRGEIFGSGVIRAEVLRGIIHPVQRERIAAFFDILPEIPTDAALWGEVAELAWKLDRRGRVLPLTDILIATSAFRVGARVVALDEHFGQIPGLRWQKELPAI